MGIYTVLEDKTVDEAIANDLKFLVEKITESVSVRSIILGGGFGRGEGSVLITDKGVEPVNDYDLFIIVPDREERDFRSLGNELRRVMGIRLLDLIPIKYSSIPTLPVTQFNYDLKYGSRHIWGEDLMDIIPEYEEGIVEEEAGRTLLLNRLICAIEAFSERFLQSTMTIEERFFLANQTSKVVSACVEALLIKMGKYHYSYRKRREIFKAAFPEKIVLYRLNRWATDFKLKPTANPKFDVMLYWEEAVREYLGVLAYYFTPFSASPSKGLWKLLKERSKFIGRPIERVELMLLLYRGASFFLERSILSRARRELEEITKVPLSGEKWEALRQRTAQYWHELYH